MTDITEVLRARGKRCTGCGACRNLCASGAIAMVPDGEGFLYPQVSEDKCVNCNLCVRRCPVLNAKYPNDKDPGCYAMTAGDEERATSASGGFVSAVARRVLARGGVVYGAAWDEGWRVRHIAAEDGDGLLKLKSSKYLQSDTGLSYRDAREKLQAGRQVLYTGTPCEIAGLYAFLGDARAENLLTIEVICHGTPSYKVFRKYLEENYKTEDIVRVDFRDKTFYKWLATMNVYLRGGQALRKNEREDYYYKAFLPCMIMRPSCEACEFSRLPRQADFTAGDFWGINRYNKKLNDNKGLSVVLVNNQKARRVANELKGSFKIWESVPLEYATFVNKTILHPFKSHPGRKHFFSSLGIKPFNRLVEDSLNHCYDVGVVGLWYGLNYGSVLTYYALYVLLRDLGYDPVMLPKPNILWEERFNDMDSIAQRFIWKRCNVFMPYRTQEDYISANDHCRDFIVGSDVVWKYEVCGKDAGQFFFLDWVESGHRKITFASSFGHAGLEGPRPYVEQAKYWLGKFDALSVRELSTVEQARRDCGRDDIAHVLDPVFLCDSRAFLDAAGASGIKREKPFVFAYFLRSAMVVGSLRQQLKVLDWASSCYGAESYVCANPNATKEFFKRYAQNGHPADVYSVEEWLYHMKNCEMFIGDGYHGLCFALLFHKPFIIFYPRNEVSRERLVDLLRLVGLEERLLDNLDNEEAWQGLIQKKIDWDEVDSRLKGLREFSVEWLKNALRTEMKREPRDFAIDGLKRKLNELSARVASQQAAIDAHIQAHSGEESAARWLKRQIPAGIRCYRQNGMKYTLRKAARKIKGRFGA